MVDDSKLRDRNQASDPLAELARLIGQDDVFEQMRRDAIKAELGAVGPHRAEPARPGASHADEVRPQTRASHPAADPYADAEPYDYDEPRDSRYVTAAAPHQTDFDPRSGYAVEAGPHYPAGPSLAMQDKAAQAHHAGPVAAVHPDPNYADGPVDPYYAAEPAYDDQVYADEYAEQQAEPEPKRRRSGALMAASIIGLAVVGTAGAYAYRSFSVHAAPPVIAADKSPAKIAPATTVSDATASKPSFDRSATNQTAKLVSKEEAPIELREARSAPPKMVGIAGSAAGAPTAAAGAPSTTASIPTNANEPKKVRTFAIRPDGTVMSDASATRGQTRAAASDSALRAAAPVRTASAPTRTASIPATPSGVAPAGAAAGTHVVQLASQKTESEAQASFRALQAKYPNVLAGREPLIRRVNLGDRGTFYRAQVGPFASSDLANDFCTSLKTAGGQCIVQRN